jgi:hypothetical protein
LEDWSVMDDRSRQPAAPEAEPNRRAALSVVLALLVLLLPDVVGVFVAAIAFVLGFVARREILRDGGRGLGLAVSGMVLGALGVAFCTWVLLR